MDMMTGIWAANKAKADLGKGGKAGYDEVVSVELVPEAEYAFNGGLLGLPSPQLINVGDEIVTVIDGIEYKGTAYSFGGLVCVGNAVVLGREDTGEPYFTAVGEQEGALMVVVAFIAEFGSEETTQHTVSVVANTKVAHTIDLKYIPKTIFRFEDYGLSYDDLAAASDHSADVSAETGQRMVDVLTTPNVWIEITTSDESSTSISKSAVHRTLVNNDSDGTQVSVWFHTEGSNNVSGENRLVLMEGEGNYIVHLGQ